MKRMPFLKGLVLGSLMSALVLLATSPLAAGPEGDQALSHHSPFITGDGRVLSKVVDLEPESTLNPVLSVDNFFSITYDCPTVHGVGLLHFFNASKTESIDFYVENAYRVLRPQETFSLRTAGGGTPPSVATRYELQFHSPTNGTVNIDVLAVNSRPSCQVQTQGLLIRAVRHGKLKRSQG
jgi:hypothetical protein